MSFASEHNKFKLILVSSLALAATTLAAGLPAAHAHIGQRADDLVRQADAVATSDPKMAAVNYRMASLLQPTNPEIITKLADAYLSLNRPDEAVKTLRRLPKGEGSAKIADIQFRSGQFEAAVATLDQLLKDKQLPATLTAKSRALLELDRADQAIEAAKQAVSYGLGDDQAALQLGLSYAASGKSQELAALISSLRPLAARQTLETAQAGQVTAAKILYAQGLLRSSQRILAKTPVLNSEGYLLLAKIELAQREPNQSELTAAKDHLVKGLAIDPGNLELHRTLKDVYRQLGDQAGFERESDLVNQLETGKI
ncbi:MAG TPA: tetratricopeptide repeat protein [Candidatus Saccharimonadales bacterium]|nr:tetratricopeptide repeat protein [Candidatus Saccharimonadales bacterium]